MARPFLKWAGGKRQLLPILEEKLPSGIPELTTYIEPFIGGGALLFHILENHSFEEVHISDLNPELTLCYRMIQSDASGVFNSLQSLIESYPKEHEDRKEVFYGIRRDWNTQVSNLHSLDINQKTLRAAQTLFLNKTCFNGLFRLNKKGEFNVPIGGYVNPSFQTMEELQEVQEALQGVSIHTASFEKCLEWANDSTLVYFDPPYRPLSETSHFVSYSKGDFDDDDQRALAAVFRELDGIGARLILSNSDPKNSNPDDDFFDDLYSGFNIERVMARRAINSSPMKRGEITEIIVTN